MVEKEIIAINVDLSCDGQCEACEKFFECDSPQKQQMFDRRRMGLARTAMSKIKHKIAVVGGKGGVGKSITTVNLATALAVRGHRVSILDQDFDGPSVPKMLGLNGKRLSLSDDGIVPVEGHLGIQVISTGLIMRDEEVLTWFHDMRRNATEEFLCHVDYGERDYLLVDMPPGTSSDNVNLMQYITDLAGAVVVTIPSEVSQGVAKKAALLCKKAKVRVFGIIENMSGFVCPNCEQKVDILRSGGGERLAADIGVPFFGRIPLDPRLSLCCDEGTPYVTTHPQSAATVALNHVVDHIEAAVALAR